MKTENKLCKVFYLTYDGLTDHIGQSQILPYILGCANHGILFHILSFEKKENKEKIDQLKSLLNQKGIQWHQLTFTAKSGAFFKAFDFLRFFIAAFYVALKNRFTVVHTRSYMASNVGYLVKKTFRTKQIFDKRDFWIDAQLETGRWKLSRIKDRIPYEIMRLFEKRLFSSSEHIVSLTETAKQIILEKYPSRNASDITVIPCCADFSFYDPAKIDPAKLIELRESLGVEPNEFMLGYVGSLGPAYLVDEMMDFFLAVLKRKPESKFLIVANNGHDIAKKAAEKKKINKEKIIITKASKSDIPYFVSLFNLSVFFYYVNFSRKACSPTRLAELFSMNIPAITNTGVGDMDMLLNTEINCSTVVNKFDDEEFDLVLNQLIPCIENRKLNIRDKSGYFALDRGVSLYLSVYKKIA